MQKPEIVRTVGWITLGALLALAPQITACDTTPQHGTEDAVRQTAPRAEIVVPPQVAPSSSNRSEPDAGEAAPSDPPPAAPATVGSTDDQPLAPGAPKVKRLVIASGIEKREPVEITQGKVAEPIVAFVELEHGGTQESGVVITFEHEKGKKVGFIQLNVPAKSPRYRTWARTRNIDQPGTWTAIVSSEDGKELARHTFPVTG